jgi:hypothetical protein
MKFCYLDESGTGGEPIAVMVGIITDHNRMRLTKSEWKSLLNSLSIATGKTVSEIHTHELYAGNSPFRQLTAQQRTNLIISIFNWLKDRKHSIVYTALDTVNFNANCQSEAFYNDIGSMWRHMAFHMTLSLQKYLQTCDKNKGNCVQIFDNKVTDQSAFTKLLLCPPTWSDTYYKKGKKQEQLDQIIDVPHFVDSKQVGLIQLADFLCYFLRKHIEFSLNLRQPKYQGEEINFQSYKDRTLKLAIPKSNIFPNQARCKAADYFYKFAPTTIR